MPTANYLAAAQSPSRRVQMLIEIDLDRCSLDYTTSPCTATNQGDGMRCFYSFGTCQDPPNYDRTTKTWRFSLREVPWTDTAYDVFPYLLDVTPISQQVDPAKLYTFPESITVRMVPDWNTPSFDTDKALFNTGTTGEFFRNLLARNRNYVGRPLRVLRGFYGLAYADFCQIGPAYTLSAVGIGPDSVTITADSPLMELNRKKLPWDVSEDNIATINDSVTTIDVVDASEYPDPAVYTRNSLYVKIDDEIIQYETRNTGANQLGSCTRGALNTTAASHTDAKVEHVALFGTDNGTSTDPSGRNPVEVLRDLMAWAGIADADIDTDSFDDMAANYVTADSTLKILTKAREIAKHMQFIREAYGLMVYLDDNGKWACRVLGPQSAPTPLDEASLLWRSVSVSESQDSRVTRVAYYYDPTEENPGEDPAQYGRSVVIIDASLEQENNYGDQKAKSFYDAWLDPAFPAASIRNLARRLITRYRNGQRLFDFDLDLKDASSLNVGAELAIQSRHLLDARGNQQVRPCVVISKKEDRAKVSYVAVDVNYPGRFMRIGPDGMAELYDDATDEDKSYGYFGDADNRVGSAKELGYFYW